MATYSSILAWEIPWTEEPGGLEPRGSQRVGPAEHARTLGTLPHLQTRVTSLAQSGTVSIKWVNICSDAPEQTAWRCEHSINTWSFRFLPPSSLWPFLLLYETETIPWVSTRPVWYSALPTASERPCMSRTLPLPVLLGWVPQVPQVPDTTKALL